MEKTAHPIKRGNKRNGGFHLLGGDGAILYLDEVASKNMG